VDAHKLQKGERVKKLVFGQKHHDNGDLARCAEKRGLQKGERIAIGGLESSYGAARVRSKLASGRRQRAQLELIYGTRYCRLSARTQKGAPKLAREEMQLVNISKKGLLLVRELTNRGS